MTANSDPAARRPARHMLARLRALPSGLARNMSAATRLSLVAVVVALGCLVITSVVGLQRGSELAEQSLRDRLTALAAVRADEVERYVDSLERATISQAISPSTAAAIDELGVAYRALATPAPSAAEEAALVEFYRDTVAPQLSAARGKPVSPEALLPRADAAVNLQTEYVVPYTADERALIDDAGDGSSWSELHRELHPRLSEFAGHTGVEDYYLIEPSEHTIVYSTAKDIDVGTSLRTGPQSGTALASLINSLPSAPERGAAVIADFTHYPPAGDEPSAFIASPVIVDDVLHGFVAVRIGPGQLTAITTDDETWTGLGRTGETYVVADDDRLRTEARGFLEDPRAYVLAAEADGTATADEIRSMRELDTTVLEQQAPNQSVDVALSGEPVLVETTNHLGANVFSASRPLDIDGVDWALIAEVDRQEFRAPTQDFVRNLLIAIAIAIVAITFLAVRWSDRLLAPLRIIATRLREVRGGGEISLVTADTLPAGSPKEFVDLATDIDTMLATLARRTAEAAGRVAERRALLRRIVPPHLCGRAEAGERDVLDQVSNATVAAVRVRGLGELLRDGSPEVARDLLDQFVEEADELAKQHGLDRVRLTGDEYVAACGTTRPHLDHARRAAAFVLDVRELVRDLSAEGGHPIAMSAGLDSGPLTVGLTGGNRLVYDSWGQTIQVAAHLARRARPDELLASGRTRSQLPASVVTSDGGEPADATDVAGVAVVSAVRSEREPIA